jgi:hypothetical protein
MQPNISSESLLEDNLPRVQCNSFVAVIMGRLPRVTTTAIRTCSLPAVERSMSGTPQHVRAHSYLPDTYDYVRVSCRLKPLLN